MDRLTSFYKWVLGNPVEERFTLTNGLHVLVKSGDVTTATAGGVVVGEDGNFTGLGAVAQALLVAGGEDYKNCRDQLQRAVKEDRLSYPVFSCPAGESLKYEYVLHAMTSFNGAIPDDWIGHFKALYFEMGRIAEVKKLSDLVTPLLGSGQGHKPLEMAIQAAIGGLSLLQPKFLRQVTIMEYDPRKASTISENFKKILAFLGTSTDPPQYGIDKPRPSMEERPSNRRIRTESTSSTVEVSFQNGTSSMPDGKMPYDKVGDSKMPDGKMVVNKKPKLHLEGFPDCGTILIEYSFANGTLGPQHPAAGQPYKGTFRRAFLPDNQEGQRVLELLEKAFKRKLTFHLVHTDQGWVVEFAHIPHKTSLRGGAKGNGYPDPYYLPQVETALKEFGLS